ncbi:hypothetical protein B0H13DRAFT_580960 [Mycena leptocephala]|nr:hypothetical protein B0H13DRAFT_580960 [Mycena leptocephala]
MQLGAIDSTPMSLAQFMAQERHDRLLRRLYQSSHCLLALAIPKHDCTTRVQRAPAGGETADFLFTGSERLFECIVVGCVQSSSGITSLHLHIALPPFSPPEMELFFRNQLTTLESMLLNREQTGDLSILLEDAIPWTIGGSSAPATAIISINVPCHASIRLNTPTRAFLPCPSNSSSTTLSSTDEPVSHTPPLLPKEGDLIAVLCTFQSRDFPRPSSRGLPVFIRVYDLTASCVEILV